MTDEKFLQTTIITIPGIMNFPKLNPDKPALNDIDPDKPYYEWITDVMFDPKRAGYAQMNQKFIDIINQFKEKWDGEEPKAFPKLEPVGPFRDKAKKKPQDPTLIGLMKGTFRKKVGTGDTPTPPPQLFDLDRNPKRFHDFYSGCIVQVGLTVREYALKHPKSGAVLSRGLSTKLNAVVFVGPGQRLGRVEEDFSQNDELFFVEGEEEGGFEV